MDMIWLLVNLDVFMQDLPLILSDPFIFRRDYYTDGAYDTKHCRKVILDRQAHAVIPPKKFKTLER
jgi:flagellar assembly factor FliW